MADEVRIPLEVVDNFSGELRSLSAQYAHLASQQNELHRRGVAGANNLAESHRNLQRTVSATERHMASLGERGGRAFQTLLSSTVRWTTYASTATVAVTGLLLREGIKLNSEFERYALTLETVQRSQAKANATLAWIVNFAKTTPFEVQGLAESATQLEALGLSARKWLPLIGDLSAAFGGSKEKIDELVRAVGLLRSGVAGEAFESLRRSGITRQDFEARGIAFDKAGSLKSDPEAALAALESIIQVRFGGLMQRLSQTFAGAMSNIQDFATNALRDTTVPLFKTVTKEANSFLEILNRLEQSGALKLLTNRAGGLINAGATAALGYANAAVIEPLIAGQGLSEIASGIFEDAKGPAAEFATWFAGRLADGIVSAIGTLATSGDGLKLLGLYAGYQALPWAAGKTFGLAGRGINAAGRGIFGGGGAAGAVGADAAMAAAIGAGYAPGAGGTYMPYHQWSQAQYRVWHPRPALPSAFGSDGSQFVYSFIDNPARRTLGQRLWGGVGAVDRFGTRLGFGATPTIGVGGMLGIAGLTVAALNGITASKNELDERYVDQMMGNSNSMVGRELRRRRIAALSGGNIDFNALHRAKLLELTGGAPIEPRAAWRMNGVEGFGVWDVLAEGGYQIGAGVASLFGGNRPQATQFTFGVDPEEQRDFQDKLREYQEKRKGVAGDLGREAFDVYSGKISEVTTKFLALRDSIDQFGDSARSNITTQSEKIAGSFEAIISKALSADQQILRKRDQLRQFGRERTKLDYEFASLTLNPNIDPVARAEGFMGLASKYQKLNADDTGKRAELLLLQHKRETDLIKQNQSALDRYSQIAGGGSPLDKFNYLKDLQEAADVRARLLNGEKSGVEFKRLIELSKTGLFSDEQVRKAAEAELHRDLISQFGREKGEATFNEFKRTGGFDASDANQKLVTSLEALQKRFEELSLRDAADIEERLAPLRDGIEKAMTTGAMAAAQAILSTLTMGMPSEVAKPFAKAFMDEVNRLIDNARRTNDGPFAPDVLPPGT